MGDGDRAAHQARLKTMGTACAHDHGKLHRRSTALSTITAPKKEGRARSLLPCRTPETQAGGGGLKTTLSTRRGEAGNNNS